MGMIRQVISVDTHKNAFLEVINLQGRTQKPSFTIFAGTQDSSCSHTDFIEIRWVIEKWLVSES